MERGVAAIVIAAAATATTRAAALKRSTRIRPRAVERDESDRDDAEKRGGQSLQDAGIQIMGACGVVMLAFKIFLSSRILSICAKTSPQLVKMDVFSLHCSA